jgi:hypothetical protein
VRVLGEAQKSPIPFAHSLLTRPRAEGLGNAEMTQRARDVELTREGATPPGSGERSRPLPWHLHVYVVVLLFVIVHAVGLMIAATIIRANPSLVPGTSVPGWGEMTFYLVTNLVLVAYGGAVAWLIVKRRRSAILHNYALCGLTICFHVVWLAHGMKSTTGVFVDSMPAPSGAIYFATSASVRQALVERR